MLIDLTIRLLSLTRWPRLGNEGTGWEVIEGGMKPPTGIDRIRRPGR